MGMIVLYVFTVLVVMVVLLSIFITKVLHEDTLNHKMEKRYGRKWKTELDVMLFKLSPFFDNINYADLSLYLDESEVILNKQYFNDLSLLFDALKDMIDHERAYDNDYIQQKVDYLTKKFEDISRKH